MFRPDDIIEATERRECELGIIEPGDRHSIHQMSVSHGFIRLHGCEGFIRNFGFRRVGRLPEPGDAA